MEPDLLSFFFLDEELDFFLVIKSLFVNTRIPLQGEGSYIINQVQPSIKPRCS